MKSFGFKILNVLNSQNWQTLDVSENIPFVRQPICPADKIPLKTICTLVGNGGKKSLKIGSCSVCGYLGHIDIPSKEWMSDFYQQRWNIAKFADINKTVELIRNRLGVYTDKKKQILNFIEKLPIDKSRYICEIGCGQGGGLKQIKELGFQKTMGVESSTHLAEIARQAYGLDVITSDFEDGNGQKQLRQLAPFSLIYFSHVLEHMRDPLKTIDLISKLQKIGDYLVIQVPNVIGGSSISCLMFLPHFHTFSRQCLKKLLNNYNYEIVDESLTNDGEINFIAQKVKLVSLERTAEKKDYFNESLLKFINFFGFKNNYGNGIRRFWWLRRKDIGGYASFYGNGFLEKIHWRILSKMIFFKYGDPYYPKSALIDNIDNQYFSYEESPLEIHFEGNIKLFYK